MEKEQNVIVVHCVHGRGRTGSAICAYLMYSGLADNAMDAIAYFKNKRFPDNEERGMKHACQIRYLFYFE